MEKVTYTKRMSSKQWHVASSRVCLLPAGVNSSRKATSWKGHKADPCDVSIKPPGPIWGLASSTQPRSHAKLAKLGKLAGHTAAVHLGGPDMGKAAASSPDHDSGGLWISTIKGNEDVGSGGTQEAAAVSLLPSRLRTKVSISPSPDVFAFACGLCLLPLRCGRSTTSSQPRACFRTAYQID